MGASRQASKQASSKEAGVRPKTPRELEGEALGLHPLMSQLLGKAKDDLMGTSQRHERPRAQSPKKWGGIVYDDVLRETKQRGPRIWKTSAGAVDLHGGFQRAFRPRPEPLYLADTSRPASPASASWSPALHAPAKDKQEHQKDGVLAVVLPVQ